jgi:uncharacterized membrane protein
MFASSLFHRLQRHRHRIRDLFAPRKPRHRALRIVLALFGVALLAMLLVIGLMVGAAMLIAGLIFRILRTRGKPIASPTRTLEGEYRILRKPALGAGR